MSIESQQVFLDRGSVREQRLHKGLWLVRYRSNRKMRRTEIVLERRKRKRIQWYEPPTEDCNP